MPTPSEHKTVQSRILRYAEAIGWTFVSREAAEQRRGFDPDVPPADRAKNRSLFFDDLLDAKLREFNPRYAEAEGALLGQFRHLHADIYGNREFVEHLRNRGKFFDHEEKRERDLILIDYDDPARNVFEVTEEWAYNNGHYGTREDVVFLINGIPVLVIECKNANKDEAIALGVDQIRRYHRETPELFVSQQLFTATDAIGFSYGVSWNTVRRNIFNWKDGEVGKLEAKVKSFCAIPQVLAFLKDYIVFAEKDEELNKYILRQHQTGAVEAAVSRALDPQRTRGLVWHTQGSGKTFTMIKAAERLFRAPGADKPTVLLMIDRNELEDQMLKNLAALGLGNLEHASSIARLNQLLRDDYRGIIVTMIHKFRDMPADLNTRSNIYVLIDEAHRTTGGDLGNFLMAGLPNATFIGFTGTPVDKTVYGKGTFKTFGCEDDQGYLHKYSIADSIEDGTTLPLYYQLAPNEMLVPHETLDKEFLSLAEAEGVADIEELNKILERAVNLKNFLKGKERIQHVAQFVAAHYRENVEPLGYKAFLVGVDREACAHYKRALDQFLPPEYSEVVYTGSNNDSKLLKEFHLDPKRERQIRKSFGKLDQMPKILIVTEKLLTGFDAPVLYAMYLDKPMRDHTLLQAIARVNRPYENEVQEMVKPHGFVLDFVGIFDKLEKALAFDSDEINAIVKDLKLLKVLFKNKMESKAPDYLGLIERNFNDKDVDTLIEHFRDPERRKEFFKEYKEIEMLYEIISPDAFLRPFIADYGTLSAIYQVVRKAYTRTVMVDREFQAKTNHLVREQVGSYGVGGLGEIVAIDGNTIELIKNKRGGDGTKVINLIKSIERLAEEGSDDPYLIAMAERARAVQESFESRQTSTAEALAELLREVEGNETRKKEQAEKSFDGLTYFVYRSLLDAKIQNAEAVSRKIRHAFTEFPNWKRSENALRELRKKVTFALFAETEDLDRVTAMVDELFTLLEKADRI
ncbi:type I restriction endonuclease subunit R [Acidithiobacillus ferrooxidans]|jgi:type I restriction enzyme R subunit|uniref:Type I restriction enzyme endonuclease subunit n=6 Tax=Acidithiobacillus TaxID=119977 RepID=B7J6Q7_ACIF2|nr:HsdR family type I site-specific deoxyribonuclease [Acidithiobacillus ferrooxidans]ACH83215.1 type I site-specific deoxyribonuclease, HsdR family [Acidithiobacillus ferrooxidans ATCC 53993]ACK79055.1 type I restriction-modification system, R subunit [Acidithiobacillus ferrooxidans ATCC 23270]MBU2775190.1 HsdR family type I site-specific deoxyribonuclease [Acidithiobacillus ferrooxidans]MBU2823090.1 HsdR family type I site-specific deoxyribonuclease [Acidithiobacillus ferrooxidans]MCR0968817